MRIDPRMTPEERQRLVEKLEHMRQLAGLAGNAMAEFDRAKEALATDVACTTSHSYFWEAIMAQMQAVYTRAYNHKLHPRAKAQFRQDTLDIEQYSQRVNEQIVEHSL